jgi:glycosyltransferase involved in cell wall biosynthesis
MGKYKIGVYAISKNEEKFADRFMDSVKEADVVVVADTGSTDDTVNRLKAGGAMVSQETIVPWRFDTARNIALSHLPEDVDLCISVDLDEVLEPGWRQILEAHWNPTYTRAAYTFAWSHNNDGSIDKRFVKEKIHRRHDFQWVHPVHEILEYTGTDPDNSIYIPEMVIHHYPDSTKSRGQYLPLLELSAEENPTDAQTIFWLGREYLFHKRYQEAITVLKRYLLLPNALWEEERSAAKRYIAKAHLGLGNKEEAKLWLFRAAAECQTVREPWLEIAHLGYLLEDWPLSFYGVQKGLAIASPQGSYLMDPTCWNGKLEDYGAISAYRLELYQLAEEYARKALSFKPEDERLQQNLKLILEKEAKLQ